ncbi:histidine kinase [Dyadobacter luteus]|uniref:Histidine kinase n=1 Tax=Dyadobacter luteus TaxID=2259619 RepID=A0A3D8Y4R1_9BACT|nr:ATP-binding protein [Dyadobacter luteus]REA56787.1 histidine kinase [Dyadobacter luteus]
MRWSTRTQYIVYILLLHLVLIFLVYKILFHDKILFIGSELFLFSSILLSVRIYQNFNRPHEFVKSGIEAIREKDFTIKFVNTGNGEVDSLIEVYNLMIDQLREERVRLQEKHFLLERLIAASPIAIVILDFDGKIESVNTEGKVLLHMGESVYKGLIPRQTGSEILSRAGEMKDGESKIIRPSGVATYKVQRSHFMDQGFRRSFLMIEELTAEMYESEKKAYGKVIRMMAHEVNNTLGATDSIIQTARHMLDAEEFVELNEALRISSERNRKLTYFMRNFADVVRLPLPAFASVNLSVLVRDVTVFMQSFGMENGVAIQTNSLANVVVQADLAQLEQVLVNVIRNAVQACRPGNSVGISLSENELVIANNGKPITEEEADHLFNPFYSSKPDGQGIGLTLSREILVNHGFRFSLKTNTEGWTEFRIGF